jgi:hypothetical protein
LYEKVQAGPGEFTASPEYQFRFGEGQRAVESSAAARGNVLGGRTLKELTRYGQGFGSNEYQNFLANYYQSLAPYQALSTQGQAAAAGTAASGLSAANTISNTTTQGTGNAGQAYMAGGNAQAAGYINQANALGNIAPNALNSYMAWKSYTPNQPANYAPAVGSPAYNQLGAAYDNYYGYST